MGRRGSLKDAKRTAARRGGEHGPAGGEGDVSTGVAVTAPNQPAASRGERPEPGQAAEAPGRYGRWRPKRVTAAPARRRPLPTGRRRRPLPSVSPPRREQGRSRPAAAPLTAAARGPRSPRPPPPPASRPAPLRLFFYSCSNPHL